MASSYFVDNSLAASQNQMPQFDGIVVLLIMG